MLLFSFVHFWIFLVGKIIAFRFAHAFRTKRKRDNQKEPRKAIDDYTKAIVLEPDSLIAHMNLIEALIITSDFDEANTDLI